MSFETTEQTFSVTASTSIYSNSEKSALNKKTISIFSSKSAKIFLEITFPENKNEETVLKYLLETSFSDETEEFSSKEEAESALERAMMQQYKYVKVKFDIDHVKYSMFRSSSTCWLSQFFDGDKNGVSSLSIKSESGDLVSLRSVYREYGSELKDIYGYISKYEVEALKNVLGELGNVSVVKEI